MPQIACPTCGRECFVDERGIGQMLACPLCGQTFVLGRRDRAAGDDRGTLYATISVDGSARTPDALPGPAPTPSDETVVFPCRKCGRLFTRPVSKVSGLVACSQCGKTNKTVAIARQPRATAGQIRQLKRSLQRGILGLALLIIEWLVVASIWGLQLDIGFAGTTGLSLFILLFLVVFVLTVVGPLATVRRHLRGSCGLGFVIPAFLFPAFFIFFLVGARDCIGLSVRLRALSKAGPRA